MDGQSTADMPLHPDRIILRADGLVEVLPTLEAAQLRRHRLTRRAELEDKAQRLQVLINQRHRKSDVASLKSILAELRQLRQLDIVDDMPGIEDAARRIAGTGHGNTRGCRLPSAYRGGTAGGVNEARSATNAT